MNKCAESCSGRWEVCPAGVCQGWGIFPELFHFYAPPMLVTCVCNAYAYIFLSCVCTYIFSSIYLYLYSYIIFLVYIFLIYICFFLYIYMVFLIYILLANRENRFRDAASFLPTLFKLSVHQPRGKTMGRTNGRERGGKRPEPLSIFIK